MHPAFGPNPAMMFLSWKQGAQASAPPVKDAFREVFQGRLLAKLTSQGNGRQGTNLRLGAGKNLATSTYQQNKEGLTLAVGTGSEKAGRMSGPPVRPRGNEVPGLRKRVESGAADLGLAAENSQSVSQVPIPKGTTPASPPPALQELINFLQSQPNGCLKIHPEQTSTVASFLLSAGLPAEEVQRLFSNPGFSEKGLSAADLQAAWQRTQGQDPAKPTSAGVQQSFEGKTQPTTAQEIVQTSDYRALWERLTLPESMLPSLRLALARLGGSPEDLAHLEEEAQGHGIPLSRVWQILQKAQDRTAPGEASDKNQPSQGANPQPSDLLGERPVTGEEVAEWQQILLKAGLKPEQMEKLLGQVSPANQEDLKTALLALAPPEEPTTVLSDPKPLYLPENLRFRPFFWQGQTNGDQAHLNGNGNGDQQYRPPIDLAATSKEAFGLPAFAAELQMLNPNGPSSGASLSDTSSVMRFLSPQMRETLWSQLQSGIISNVRPGESQVSLNLNPPEMGQIQLILRLSGQELAVTAVASRPEVAELANQGVQQLLQALANQGLVLTQFQMRLQEQPGGLTTNILATAKEKNSQSGEKFPSPTRRRNGEVNRFV